MVKSEYLEGTNKKAFVISDEHSQIMFTYVTPAVYVIDNGDPIRIWDGYRVNSGKHILKFNKNLTKKVWESMEVKPSPCTGKYVLEDKPMGIEVDFGTKSFLILGGDIILCKAQNGKVYRVSNEVKFYKRYSAYITKFLGREITKAEWDEFEVKEDLSF